MKSLNCGLLRLAHTIIEDSYSALINRSTDCDEMLDLRKNCAYDMQTISRRVENEGLSFLTITLPKFCADFELALKEGVVNEGSFRSYRKIRRSSRIPCFLRGIVLTIFSEGGKLRNEVSPAAIGLVRQCTKAFKKINLDCTQSRVDAALSGFVETERVFESPIAQADIDKYSAVAGALWDPVFYGLDLSDLLPKHGPGSTSDGKKCNQKYVWDNWFERLEPYFPISGFGYSNPGIYDDLVRGSHGDVCSSLKLLAEADELPVKITTVPKTLEKPRIIGLEPTCLQYCQQALKAFLVEIIEDTPPFAGHINFSDQTINACMALYSSKTGKYATIDLSAASDRVPNALSMRMFAANQDLLGALQACRSRKAKLPTGEVITLKKFSSMGSATCFPVEAMYFYTLCIVGLLDYMNLPPYPHNIRSISKDIFVYGDDIIVPTDAAPHIIATLQKYYCKVGNQKSYWTGKFRESCGLDAYDGVEVTPTYIRRIPPDDKKSTESLISWVETANFFKEKGYESTFRFMKRVVTDRLGPLPNVTATCEGLGWVVDQEPIPKRWSSSLQKGLVHTFVRTTPSFHDKIDGYPALTKCLLSLERTSRHNDDGLLESYFQRIKASSGSSGNPASLMGYIMTQKDRYTRRGERFSLSVPGHLSRSDRPYATGRLKRRWIQP